MIGDVPESRRALLVGATGLVGSHVLARLIASPAYASVAAWVRRPLELPDSKARAEVVDFERLEGRRIEAQDVYCCLGTTLRRAGSREAFRRVDFGLATALARAAARDGVRRLLVVSALGANARSPVFYNRIKGEMEQAVRAAGVPQTYLFRPSLLAGPRKEFRLGERVGLIVGTVLGPVLGNYRPIHVETVAKAMLAAATRDLAPGVYESWQIAELARAEGAC